MPWQAELFPLPPGRTITHRSLEGGVCVATITRIAHRQSKM